MKPTRARKEAARAVYEKMLRQGVPPERARTMLVTALARMRDAGMGAEEPATAASLLQKAAEHEAVKSIRATVSPWLWVLSLVSFGMAVVNRRQIATMFGNWKRRGFKGVKARRATA